MGRGRIAAGYWQGPGACATLGLSASKWIGELDRSGVDPGEQFPLFS